METFLICLVLFLVITAAMAVGLIMNKRIKGSCGGVNGDDECTVCGKTSTKKLSRLEQMKKDPYRRIDSDDMTEVEKMDAGFTHGTYNINGRDVDF